MEDPFQGGVKTVSKLESVNVKVFLDKFLVPADRIIILLWKAIFEDTISLEQFFTRIIAGTNNQVRDGLTRKKLLFFRILSRIFGTFS